jgi:hemerythrin
MKRIEWKPAYETGIAAVDHEHATLIAAINGLLERTAAGCPDDEAARALGEIHALVQAHFALEERIMRDRRVPGFGAHKNDHERLLDDIRDIMDDVGRDGGGDRDAFAERLHDWFADHFASLDRGLHQADGRS